MTEILYNAASIVLAALALVGLITSAFFVMELAAYIKDKRRRKKGKTETEEKE